MNDVYIGLALAALILYGIHKYIEKRKTKKGDKGPVTGGPLPPDPVEEKHEK